MGLKNPSFYVNHFLPPYARSIVAHKRYRARKIDSLVLENIYGCNLTCKMCPIEYTEDPEYYMSAAEVSQILLKLPDLKKVTIIGRGESMMHPEIWEMVDMFYQRGLRTSIVTNGTLINSKNVHHYKKISNVVVSIDGGTEETYKDIRGASLEKLFKRIKLLRQTCPDTEVSINYLISKQTAGELCEIVQWAIEHNVTRINLLHLINFGEEMAEMCEINLHALELSLSRAKKLAYEHGILLDDRPIQPNLRKHSCSEPWHAIKVALNGDIFPCCYVYESDGNWEETYAGHTHLVPQDNYKMGNILTDDIDAIWRGEKYEALRKEVSQLNTEKLVPTIEEFAATRAATDVSKQFAYCSVCLWRWQCAC